MSGLDQPILIANSNFHVGHERSFKIAEERGFLREEGLDPYVYERGGLIPGKYEFDALGQVMKERGVDIATGPDVRAAIVQRSRGEDVYIVGGWRTALAPKLIGARGVNSLDQLRGGRIVVTELWDLGHLCPVHVLGKVGIDTKGIEWIGNRALSYSNDPTVKDWLASGEVTALPLSGQLAEEAIREGYHVLLDFEEFYNKELGYWPPGRVIVATKQTIEWRGAELGAFLRANLRAYWFMADEANFEYLYDLETRLRQVTHNEDERRLRIVTSRGQRRTYLPMDGLVARPALASMIEDMVQAGQLERPIPVDEILKDAIAVDAYRQLVSRGLIGKVS